MSKIIADSVPKSLKVIYSKLTKSANQLQIAGEAYLNGTSDKNLYMAFEEQCKAEIAHYIIQINKIMSNTWFRFPEEKE